MSFYRNRGRFCTYLIPLLILLGIYLNFNLLSFQEQVRSLDQYFIPPGSCKIIAPSKQNSTYNVVCATGKLFECEDILSSNSRMGEALKSGGKCPKTIEEEDVNFCSLDNAGSLFLDLMKRRRNRIKSVCSNSDLHFTVTAPSENILFFDKLETEWCAASKSGDVITNTFLCPLYHSDCENQLQNPTVMWDSLKKSTGSLKHRLMITRDPFERVLAAYKEEIQVPKTKEMALWNFAKIMEPFRFLNSMQCRDQSKPSLVRTAKTAIDQYLTTSRHLTIDNINIGGTNPYLNPMTPTFPEFVTAILLGQKQDYWEPIERFCSPCSRDYTFVLKSEHLECELKALSESFDKLTIDESGYKTEQRVSMSEFFNHYGRLSDHQLDSLHEWYKEDCELFGYDCRQTLCQIKRWKTVNL